jgi:hypothetical protein
VLAVLAATTALTAVPATAEPSKVSARYDISFNGLSIGTFRFNSEWTSRAYRLKAGARISLLNGILFEWKARTQSEGQLTSGGPRPRSYSFGYESGEKSGSVDLRFSGTSVSHVNVDPPPGRNRVPVKPHHMRGVVDPLSSVILLSQLQRSDRGKRSCNETLRVFDGKMRYDLTLRYKQTRRVSSSGYSGPAYVCSVNFKPLAGHKPNKEETNFFEKTDGIEVWLIPARQAGMYIPYHIRLPLPIGSATLTSESFEVERPRDGRLIVIGSS